MTTITVDEDCLKNVDKLQSLLKLRYDNLSGESITRGATVEWAVNQQISAMTVPVKFLDNFIDGTINNTPTISYNSNWQNSPGQTMCAYMVTSTSLSLPSVSLTSNTPDATSTKRGKK